MDVNESGTVNQANTTRSVFYCWYFPSFTWELGETTLPWVIFSITVFASPVTVLLNVLEIVAVRTKKQLQRVSTVLLCSMAVADLLVGAVSMPLTAAVDLLIAHQTWLDNVCILDFVGITVAYCACWTALSHLTVIAWERYVAITNWSKYLTIMTRSKVQKLAIVAWLCPILVATPYIMAAAGVDAEIVGKLLTLLTILTGAPAIILIVCLYFMVYLEVRKRKTNEIVQVNAFVKAKMEANVAKTTGVITGTLIFFFLLPVVATSLEQFFPVFRKSSVFRLIETFMQLNSLANPLIYCYRDRRFRNAVIELLRHKKSEEMLPAAGAVRVVRRKNPLGSQEDVLEHQIKEKRIPLRRTTSLPEEAVVVECENQASHGMKLKRSMSAPSLVTGSTWRSAVQTQQRLRATTVIATATVHAQRDVQDEAKNNPTLPEKYAQLKQISRSKSHDISASLEFAICRLNIKGLSRPKTAPSRISANATLGDEAPAVISASATTPS